LEAEYPEWNVFIAFGLRQGNGVDEISKDLPSCQEYIPRSHYFKPPAQQLL
jgi:hypothetical protein